MLLIAIGALLAASRARHLRRSFRLPRRDAVATFTLLALLLTASRARREWRSLPATLSIEGALRGLLPRLPRPRSARVSRFTPFGREAVRLPGSVPAVALPRSGLRRRPIGIGFRNAAGLAALVVVTAASSVILPELIRGDGPVQARTGSSLFAGSLMRSTVGPAEHGAGQEDGGPAPARVSAMPVEPYRVTWPYEIVDGLTFGPEGAVKTRLAGLEGPPRDAVCNDRDSRPWACGLQARAALNNVTRRQNLTCEPAAGSEADPILARCGGEIDVARELVLAGFARPSVRSAALEEAEDEARRAERGLWNGGWSVRIPAR